tara:strand:+ start:1283 stop:4864 length:3582 start_codon:yes stop_codon:yes gene_type:complete
MPAPSLIHLGLLAALVPAVLADSTSLQAPNGLYQRYGSLDCHAIIGADLVPKPGERIEAGTIVIRNGVIEAIGADVSVPPEAQVWHAEDMTIYPGFVEPALMVETGDAPTGMGSHWNARIRSQVDLSNPQGLEPLAASTRSSMRQAGYAVAAAHPSQGILRGRGLVVPMAENAVDVRPYHAIIPMSAGFDRGGWGAGYPNSLMGAIAMMRQSLLDAQWHEACLDNWERDPGRMQRPPRRDALAAMQDVINRRQPLLIETGSLNNAARAGAIADEFDLDLWLVGTGDEYQNLTAIKQLECPIIVPLEFPSRPDLASLEAADRISLESMQQWEQAPTNLRRLVNADVDLYVTSTGLGRPDEIRSSLRKAIETGGLDKTMALELLTTRPAELLGIDNQVGTLKPGKAAHLVICSGDLFDKKTKIHEVWIAGTRHDYDKEPMAELAGKGTFTSGDQTFKGSINTSKKSFSIDVPVPKKEETPEGDEQQPADETPATETIKGKSMTVSGHRMWGVIDSKPWGQEGWARFGGRIQGEQFAGRGRLADGTPFTFDFVVSDDAEEDDEAEAQETETAEAAEGESQDPIAGTWMMTMEIPGADFTPEMEVVITRDGDALSGTIMMMQNEQKMDSLSFDEASGTLEASSSQGGRSFTFKATVNGNSASGTASSPFGEFAISCVREGADGAVASAGKDDEENSESSDIPEQLAYPMGAFGRLSPPEQEDIRIENATIWTSGPAGIIEDGCMITRDGKIAWVGPMSEAPEASGLRIIDATGLHITPGLIDCHSHTGINGGVNEGSEACTAEVRIADVVDAEDIGWYRQLAGGLTACNQLHGSANPIGGQNSVVKLKWGRQASEFKVTDAIGGIKFALGENVKRSTGRYPNTRMGVNSFMRDRFMAAKAYRDEWSRWNEMSDEEQRANMPPRRDLEMDTLIEILEGERLVHCHSYRQDEILALLRLAEEMEFTIGTLQHILEGYKVADAIADHGAGASSFSDWWAYKVEVMDAIPYNGAIMRDVGVNVSFNSDDNELATRMNDEAAKAVRYGGVDRAEALHFVTINPAWQLRIDHRTGSLEQDKDADFVIWSEDPLSSYSRCLETWIEGAKYFDEDEDLLLRDEIAQERRRLTGKVLAMAIGNPSSLKAHDEDDHHEEAEETMHGRPEGPPRRRGRRGRPTEEHVHEFPYEDHDERGVCGCDEVNE